MEYIGYLIYVLAFAVVIAIILFNNKYREVLKKADKYTRSAKNGYVCGLLSVVLWIIPLFGFPCSTIGIILSTRGLKSNILSNRAKIGLVLSIIFLIASITNSVAAVLMK